MADFVTTAKRGSWASRFTPQICEMWRQLQDELRDRGPTTLARDIEQRIRMVMGVVAGHDLPERRLHQASFPTRSKRPEMRSLWEAPANKADVSRTTTDDLPAASQAVPTAPSEPSKVIERAPAALQALLSDDELVELHKDAQHLLSFGETPAAVSAQVQLERELVRALDLDCFDRVAISFILDELHVRAFDTPTRPPRLEIEAPGDPREDY